MRIDNFVYTEQSFREVMQHLNPNGIVFVKFRSIGRGWPSASLKCYAGFLASLLWYLGLKPATAPMQHASRYLLAIELRMHGRRSTAGAICAQNGRALDSGRIPITTDDWPYSTSKGAGFANLLLSGDLLPSLLSPPGCTRRSRQLPPFTIAFFFAMGAGFLLLETQLVSRLACSSNGVAS